MNFGACIGHEARMDVRRILLITNFSSDSLSGGAAIIRHWVARLAGVTQIEWVSLARRTNQVQVGCAHVTAHFDWLDARGNVRLGLAPFWQWYKRAVWSGRAAQRLVKRLRGGQFDVVWFVFDFGLAPVVLRMVPVLRSYRVHISLHDEPCFSARREGCSAAFLEEVRALREKLRELDATIDSVSEELLSEVAPEASRTAIITLPAVPAQVATEFRKPSRQGPLRVGYAGTFYGRREFEAFVAGLDRWAKRTGRTWSMASHGDVGLALLSPRIEAHGPTAPSLVRSALSDCDILLLPSPLDRPEMRSNMPTKLVTYVELGRPIFAFAPAGSATERVVRMHALGPTVTDLSSESIDAALDSLSAWDIAATETGRRQLLGNRFNEERMASEIFGLLGVALPKRCPHESQLQRVGGADVQDAASS